MLFKAEIVKDIAGVKRGFKFGMLASGYFCESEGITLKQMTERLSDPTPNTLVNCFFSAAKAYNKYKKVAIDFDTDEVALWIDEVGIEEMSKILYEAMATYKEPETEGDKEKKVIAPIEGQTGV